MKRLRPLLLVVWWLSLCLVLVPAVWAMPFVPATVSHERPLTDPLPTSSGWTPSFAVLQPLPSEGKERWLIKARSIGGEIWHFWFHSQKRPLSSEASLFLLWLNTLPALLLVGFGLFCYTNTLRE